MTLQTLPPLSLYVHLPWCVRKCPYCDFNSYAARGALPERRYVAALLRDLDTEASFAQGRPLATIFIGGGTPSLFSAAAIDELLGGIRARVPLAPEAEVTLEANPGAIEARRFAGYREAGVNRLSIGLQSLRDTQLQALGRVHDADEAKRAVATARSVGFDNVNVDLMYGLPGDDVIAGAVADLTTAIDLEPTHLSWYQLTLEPGTAFHRQPPQLPSEDVVLDIEAAGRDVLSKHGFERYEISAHARAGHRCTHNLNYWQFGDYLGLGAGAHGKITLPGKNSILRRAKTRNPRTYADLAGTGEAVTVTPIDSPQSRVLEFMMNALRLAEGIDVELFEQRTGQPVETIAAALHSAAARGWLTTNSRTIRPTPSGLQMLNAVLTLF
jgi:putative oxygen-independent coproporphyrinogen III oxidase